MKQAMPNVTRLAYTVYHETEWWQQIPAHLRPNDGRRCVQIAASTHGAGGAGVWEFGVVEHDRIGLKLGMFDEAWQAFAQIPEFFAVLVARGQEMTLEHVVSLLDSLGAVDETERAQAGQGVTP